jgi:predicted dehydrogenase
MPPISRRTFAASTAFTIVPRDVLGGAGQVAPSDKVNVACIGMGRQGMVVMMDLLARPDVRVTAVCDCNKQSKDYAEYGANALLTASRRLLGKGYENYGDDLASPGTANLTATFQTSLGAGGREPARRIVDAYYESRKDKGSAKGCAAYADYRELLARETGVDAVYIATPDHWHAPITLAAMQKRKHVLCQKPMTHTIGEARRVAALARELKLATSLPVNNPSSDSTKLIMEWLADGAIGKVREVHNWSSRPYWPQGVPRPTEPMPIPEGFDWNMWLGPAPERPYHKIYAPFAWRGWVDFGCGSFGDMGCYSFAGLFKILGLTPPAAVESTSSEAFPETYPLASMVHVDFPATGSRGEIRLSWYDGGLRPPRPKGLIPDDDAKWRGRGEGVMYVGDKGILLGGFNGDSPRVYPESPKYTPPHRQRRSGEGPPPDRAIDQWVNACKGGPTPAADFVSQAPVTETFLLGCLTQRRPGEKFIWDSTAMRITNSEDANKLVDPPYRGEWT